MKQTTIFLFPVLCALVLLTSCPYEAKFALGKADACPIDSALLGLWMNISYSVDHESPNDTSFYDVTAFNATEYLIEFSELRKGAVKEETNLRAFETKIGTVRILNITEIGKSQFSFYKFVFEGEKLNVSYLSDKFIKEQFAGSNELNKFVTKNIAEKTIFEDNVVFTKVK